MPVAVKTAQEKYLGRMFHSPSPLPSPQGRGRIDSRLVTNRSAPGVQQRGRSGSLSLGLSHTHISRPKEVNPKGIPSLSPGLRAASYPGCESNNYSSTLKGLKRPARPTKAREEPAPRYNPFRVEHAPGTQPRVARGSQPWANGYNPVGIEKRLPDLWGMVSPTGEDRVEGEQSARLALAATLAISWGNSSFRVPITLLALCLMLAGCHPAKNEPEVPEAKVNGDTVIMATNSPQLAALTIEPVGE